MRFMIDIGNFTDICCDELVMLVLRSRAAAGETFKSSYDSMNES